MTSQNNSASVTRTPTDKKPKRWTPVWVVTKLVTVVIVLMLVLQNDKIQWPTTSDMQIAVQVGITAVITMFIGVLARNNSQDQAQAAIKLSCEQELRTRSSDLMARQAAAINHLSSNNDVIRAAGITEIIWLICGWHTLTCDSINIGHLDAAARWPDHAEELVDLAYKVNIDGGKPSPAVVEARAKGLVALQKELAGNPIKGLEDAFQDLSFEEAILPQAYLVKADLHNAHLEGAHLQGAHLIHTQGAHLQGADLQGAHLQGAHLQGADLQGAHLQGADLIQAMLGKGLDERGAELSGADLSGAHLEGADLSRANLEGTDLSGAHLQGADLRSIRDLKKAVLIGAEYYKDDDETVFKYGHNKTLFDDEFDPESAGMINKPPKRLTPVE